MSTQTNNKDLVNQFPFLLPRNRWTGETPANFDFGFTELNAMPDGWRIAFGEDFCKEIMEELVQNNCVDSYRIIQIKEKYGQLRWYCRGGTERIHREIIPKYEELSVRTCIKCGQPATLISTGWIAPWCHACADKFSHQNCVDIDEFYEAEDDEE